MKAWQNYFHTMQAVVEDVLETQEEAIMKAARILADTRVVLFMGLVQVIRIWFAMMHFGVPQPQRTTVRC